MSVLSQPTIEDLIGDVRNMLNQPSSTNSFWTDEELSTYLNEAVRRCFHEILMHSEGQFVTTSDLNITSGANTISLPSDFFQMKNVWRKVTGGYEKLTYRNNLTEGYSTESSGSGDGFKPDYSFRGNSLLFNETPGFSETAGIKIEYVQFPETLVTGGDSLTAQISPVYKDLIEMYAVWKAKLKESLVSGASTAGPAKENLNDLFIAFREVIGKRDSSPTSIIPFNPECE